MNHGKTNTFIAQVRINGYKTRKTLCRTIYFVFTEAYVKYCTKLHNLL